MRGSASGSGLKYADDTGFEARCGDCSKAGRQAYWPLTLEFWDPSRYNEQGQRLGRSMKRCRACWKRKDAALKRARLSSRPELRERVHRANAAYRAECRPAIRIAQRAVREGKAA